jgi:hypothetical protein
MPHEPGWYAKQRDKSHFEASKVLNGNIVPRCQAYKRNSDEQCGQPALKGKNVCGSHGGKSPSGMEHPNFKNGRHSKHLPTKLLAKYEESLADEELISLRDDVALVDAFISDALESINFDNCQAAWDGLELLHKQFWNGTTEDKLEAAREAFNIVKDGVEEWRKVGRIFPYIEQKRKLAESEMKRLKDLQLMIDAKQANTLIAALLESVNSNVSDKDARVRIANDIAGLLNRAA